MEKVVYVVWKKPEATIESFGEQMRGPVAKQLVDGGARALAVDLADEKVAFAAHLKMSRMEEPMSGLVSVWLDTSLRREAVEKALAAVTSRSEGYLVLESVPLVDTKHVVPPGERTPGFTTVAYIRKPQAMAYEDWREQWQGHHTWVAIETQSTFLYIQNAVIRALTDDAPPWVAIVEEGFPADALRDQKVFYAAGDSDAKLEENRGRMIESCRRFIEFDRLESHLFSQYLLAP
jgi:hypothetical protein